MKYSESRIELDLLRARGYALNDPFDALDIFELQLAEFFGAKYAIAIDSCTHSLELCLRFLFGRNGESANLSIPRHTYPSVPMTLMKLGIDFSWDNRQWHDFYEIAPSGIYDASTLFEERSYQQGAFFCLSFQAKKHLPIGRGGMILTDSREARDWLQKARYDGRDTKKKWHDDQIDQIGFHYYMTPEDAARGVLLFEEKKGIKPKRFSWRDYPDISTMPVFCSLQP